MDAGDLWLWVAFCFAASVGGIVRQRVDISKNPLTKCFWRWPPTGVPSTPARLRAALCKTHDFKEFTWRHLSLFQHRVLCSPPDCRGWNCPEHGIKRVKAPWARKGSHFTPLFEQEAMTLVWDTPILGRGPHHRHQRQLPDQYFGYLQAKTLHGPLIFQTLSDMRCDGDHHPGEAPLLACKDPATPVGMMAEKI